MSMYCLDFVNFKVENLVATAMRMSLSDLQLQGIYLTKSTSSWAPKSMQRCLQGPTSSWSQGRSITSSDGELWLRIPSSLAILSIDLRHPLPSLLLWVRLNNMFQKLCVCPLRKSSHILSRLRLIFWHSVIYQINTPYVNTKLWITWD